MDLSMAGAAAAAVVPPASVVATTATPVYAQGALSLYVGNLDPSVMEDRLFAKFSEVGRVTSVRVCRDFRSRRSLGYGYVNFMSTEDAKRAIDQFNHEDFSGRLLRVAYSQRDPSLRKSGVGNIFISNLHRDIDSKTLHDTFSEHGNVLSCRVSTDPSTGKSRGYGYVHFGSEEEARRAIESLNGGILMDMPMRVSAFKTKAELQREQEDSYNNVFVKGLPLSWNDDNLNQLFGQQGEIKRSTVRKLDTGKSKGYGFVQYATHEAAANAVKELNGKQLEEGATLTVMRALKKSELQDRRRGMMQTARKHEGENLYVKNIDENTTEADLRKLFETCGTIKSCKIMFDPSGRARGFGFVSFGTQEEATKAVTDINGKFHGTKPLYVGKFQTKEDRRNQMQMQFELRHQTQMTMGMYPAPFAMPMQYPSYPAAAAAYMGQRRPPGAGPAMPQQGRYPTQYQRPGMPPMMNMGGRPRQQMMYNNAMPPNPAMGGARRPPAPPARSEPLNSASLAAMSAPEQKQAIGERLYPEIEQRHPGKAAKITGMLLEMDTSELLHLLEDPAALMAKEQEAIKVLQESSKLQ